MADKLIMAVVDRLPRDSTIRYALLSHLARRRRYVVRAKTA
jgi:hypothetical protein